MAFFCSCELEKRGVNCGRILTVYFFRERLHRLNAGMRQRISVTMKSLLHLVIILPCLEGFRWKDLKIHSEHMAIYFQNNPEIAKECEKSSSCPFNMHLNRKICWGYENDCQKEYAYSHPSCPGEHRGWVRTKEEQIATFYSQGDFGFIQEQREELKTYCHPEQEGDSVLECSDHMRFCRGKYISIDFRDLASRKEPVLYNVDVLKHGQVSGHCKLDKSLHKANSDQISFLQSWGPELQHFTERKERVQRNAEMCDVWVEDPAVIMKLDATSNMYHHFCDFFNLYAAQHVNNSDAFAFSRNNQVLLWTTYTYRSNFGAAFDAFTKNKIWNLEDVKGRRVCFKNVMFPLLPRMIFGLYYNTPIIWGCENSGLFHAFSRHILHRLDIPERSIGDGRIHVTFLVRDTKYRRILNQPALIRALEKNKEFYVRKAEYSHQMDFRQQLRQDQWTDIFIGMHGAGLTHLLFLPDWAVLFEIYNCGDANCYQDLARLRGIKYLTWEDQTKLKPEDEGHHPDIGAHEKFTNYEFNVKEFMRLMQKAVDHVKNHRGWQNLQENLRLAQRREEL
ncbi:EGF domain-specific O-linked N-acetylglucosamine transferase isoform X1 [Penaeus vannamei]|uniref:EGF domain-specific O-linked N-acetylglucosamine transferase isoform X1 n=2 Tax=Penaeus vannamei TaxID=6689 RepID=UPI00387F3D46